MLTYLLSFMFVLGVFLNKRLRTLENRGVAS